jgi:hypothetical protein
MIERREAIAQLLRDRPDELLVVTGLGSPTYDVAAAGDVAENFYLWGAMGGAASIGLGLAQARKDKRVAVITGDGEMLMGMGSLATIGAKQPGEPRHRGDRQRGVWRNGWTGKPYRVVDQPCGGGAGVRLSQGDDGAGRERTG